MRLRIGTKLTLGFLLVGVAVWAAGHLSLDVLQDASLDAIGDNLDDEIALAMETVRENITNRLEALHWFDQAASLSRYAELSNEEFSRMSKQQREALRESTEGDWIAGRQTPLIEEILGNGLSGILKSHVDRLGKEQGYALFTEILVANRYGTLIGASGRTTDYIQDDEKWYQACLTDGKQLGDVRYDASSDSLAIAVAVALTDDDGNFSGAVKGVLNIEYVARLVQYLETRSRYRSFRAYLVDRDGRAILSSPAALPQKGGRDLRLPEFGQDLSAANAVAQAMDSGKDSGHIMITDDGRETLAVFSRFRPLPKHPQTYDLGWMLIAEFDAEEVLQHVRRAKRSLLLASLVAMALAVFGGVVFARSVSGRIGRLTATAAEIAKANQTTELEEAAAGDEVDVLTRTFHQMTENLAKAQSELEARNAELARFTYTVSHDLKSPLITIKGYLGILAEDLAAGKAEQVADAMARIGGAADKMAELLHDLLELSRVGRQMSPPEEIALADLVQEVLELVEGPLREHRVQTEVSADLPVVYGDRVRLREALQNLVENAVKYMGDQPEPRIEIDALRGDEEVTCRVRDNGVGIDPHDQAKIFGLFNQLDKQSEGTGIGLALVQRIVEVHRGRIWVESEGLGKGSTFCFALPCMQKTAQPATPGPSRPSV
ncbi:MAG: sensor histidine kinase [Pirellulales bacterium]|nr:sensor histidine kinase [Pirellulales bacterium]